MLNIELTTEADLMKNPDSHMWQNDLYIYQISFKPYQPSLLLKKNVDELKVWLYNIT